MLTTRVELWPHGDAAAMVVTVAIANIGGDTHVGDDACVVGDEAGGPLGSAYVEGHRRAAGAAPLVARAMTAALDPSVADVDDAMAQRLLAALARGR